MKKSFQVQLLKTLGVSKNTVLSLQKSLGLNTRVFIDKLKRQHLSKINQRILKLNVGKPLKDQVRDLLNFSIMIRTYRGLRHKFNYPVRGQRTHTNAKTKKKIQVRKKKI